jgi:metal iron transporter
MNCPSRTDPEIPDGHNQSPSALNSDATTRADLGFVANTRARDDHRIDCHNADDDMGIDQRQAAEEDGGLRPKAFASIHRRSDAARKNEPNVAQVAIRPSAIFSVEQDVVDPKRRGGIVGGAVEVVRKYLKFVGPGFMVAVAYIDPGEILFPLQEH